MQSVDHDSLRAAIQAALPKTDLGELDGIKTLPGVVRAAADTLQPADSAVQFVSEIHTPLRALSRPRSPVPAPGPLHSPRSQSSGLA